MAGRTKETQVVLVKEGTREEDLKVHLGKNGQMGRLMRRGHDVILIRFEGSKRIIHGIQSKVNREKPNRDELFDELVAEMEEIGKGFGWEADKLIVIEPREDDDSPGRRDHL